MDAVSAPLANAKRIVVKIGSALLVDAETGQPARAWLDALAEDIDAARKNGARVVIVSSGAIALGRRVLGLARTLKLEEKQAAAAAGQARLMRAYEQAFERFNIPVAQALLTPDDTEQRRRWLNGRATLETLLELGAVPIINENDTVATAEIRYGDNDRLAARVAQMISADVLVLALRYRRPLRRRSQRVNPRRQNSSPEVARNHTLRSNRWRAVSTRKPALARAACAPRSKPRRSPLAQAAPWPSPRARS